MAGEPENLSLSGLPKVITFNTEGGPVELHQAERGDRTGTLEDVLKTVRVCLEQSLPAPRAFTLNAHEFHYLLTMVASKPWHAEKNPR